MKILNIRLSMLALIIGSLCFAHADGASSDPSGTWKWVAPANPDGTAPKISFTLKLQGNSVIGTRTTGVGAVAVLTNGVVHAADVSFETPLHNTASTPQKLTFTRYHGTLEGDSIKGTEEIFVNGQKFSSRDWEIERVGR